jgi:hypothetical protein
MKNIILILLIIGLFSCKKESYSPQLVNLEFIASFSSDNNQVVVDTVFLMVENKNTKEIISSKHAIYKNKPSVVNLIQFHIPLNQELHLSIRSIKDDNTYLYLNAYKHKNHKTKVDFKDYKDILISNSKEFYRFIDVK